LCLEKSIPVIGGELDNGHCDVLLPVEGQTKSSIFNKVCCYRQPLPKESVLITAVFRAYYHSKKFSIL
jgi:hypothetical protein